MSSRREDRRGASVEGGFAVGQPRVLLAHNATAATCDALARLIEASGAELVDASSSEDARLAVASETFDACLICLDLAPAPVAGARLARELLERGYPVVIVTRSLRWLPADATELHALPWIRPEASADELRQAIAAASEEQDSMIRVRASVDAAAAAGGAE